MSAAPSGDRQPWILALHSSSDTLGVGLQRLGASGTPTVAAFPLGRAMANRLIECIETVLPARHWSRLGRLAVATGPGGFTGTRLTVVFARTVAQQLSLPLDGISSFRLIARRRLGAASEAAVPFWLAQDLPRRGTVAGLYAPDSQALGGVAELMEPTLLPSSPQEPCFPAVSHLPDDVAELLAFSQAAAAAGVNARWQTVVPLYPTSPVQAP
jgi:tRNA threonylcarbamoyl adenosine modification protein YeaZ